MDLRRVAASATGQDLTVRSRYFYRANLAGCAACQTALARHLGAAPYFGARGLKNSAFKIGISAVMKNTVTMFKVRMPAPTYFKSFTIIQTAIKAFTARTSNANPGLEIHAPAAMASTKGP